MRDVVLGAYRLQGERITPEGADGAEGLCDLDHVRGDWWLVDYVVDGHGRSDLGLIIEHPNGFIVWTRSTYDVVGFPPADVSYGAAHVSD